MVKVTCKQCSLVEKTFINLNADDFKDGWVCGECEESEKKQPLKVEDTKLPEQEIQESVDLSQFKVDGVVPEEKTEIEQRLDEEEKALEEVLSHTTSAQEETSSDVKENKQKKKGGRPKGSKSKAKSE